VLLERNGRFLSSNLREKEVVFESTVREETTPYQLLSINDFKKLMDIVTRSWISAETRDLQQIRFLEQLKEPVLCLDDIRFSIADLLGSIDAEGCINVLSENWKLRQYRPFRPLIYFCAFGKPEVFSCLKLLVSTLMSSGHYKGAFAIISDQPEYILEPIFEGMDRHRWRLLHLDAHDLMDFTFARYRILELLGADEFSPLLYLDTDIICSEDINPLLVRIAFAPNLCCCDEGPLGGEFYGSQLFEWDGFDTKGKTGFTSGIIGIPHAADAWCFRLVVASGEAFALEKANRTYFRCMDQPHFNYIVHKRGYFNFDVLTGSVNNLLGQFYGWNDVDDVLRVLNNGVAILTHFCGGVGNAGSKFEAMVKFVDALSSHRGAQAQVLVRR
jgi:hypothetical protein